MERISSDGSGQYDYKRIDIRPVTGLREAERLVGEGWKAILGSWDTVLLERKHA